MGRLLSKIKSRQVAISLVGLSVLLMATACSASRRSAGRLNVLRAENIDYRQQISQANDEIKQANLREDEALAREQQSNHERRQLEGRLVQAEQGRELAIGRMNQLTDELAQRDAALDQIEGRLDTLATRPDPVRPPTGPAVDPYQPSPAVAALQRDLQAQMSQAGLHGLPVEVRMEADGRQRVAVVLPDAFPSGKATLAYNANAVKAVVGLGKIIQRHYPSATVSVEGHTDSDRIVKTKHLWRDNQHLSEARADAVRELLSGAGVPGDRMNTLGWGASRPLEPGSTKRAKSRNRRVEMFVTP